MSEIQVVNEATPPTGFPWRVEMLPFHRFEEALVELAVRGYRGGLKARLNVRLGDLKEAISKLEE